MRRALVDAKGLNATYHGQFVSIRELIQKLYLEEIVSPPVSGYKETSSLTPEQFIYNLEYAAKDIIKDEKLKKRLLKNLSDYKLKVGEDKKLNLN